MKKKIIGVAGIIVCVILRVSFGTDTATWWDAFGLIIGVGGGWMLSRPSQKVGEK